MGAHDWIDEPASCPRCDHTHACQIQFDFRFPDYHDQVSLRRGQWVAGPDLELGEVTGSGYVRVRALGDGSVIVAEQLDLYSILCFCGAALLGGVVVDVDLADLRMRLVDVRWLDIAAFCDTSAPPAHYVPEEWATVRTPDGKRVVPPSHERRRAVFAEHAQRWLDGVAKQQS